eukprot:Gregarina_sp_Poly_1__4069@NODE_2237_length_2427_cov_110_241102_g1414_i1_p1_GENE_NODE_2237_length_2427_cov_110_241102_g1414_i1NODE_2237_length_2427_cov_110_241102_g1414_i1_p1_ORF_typecomplete_len331_score32_59KH_1/PF00013_29/1_3e03KH_1/PF00013_29/5_6e07KH_2/PF07650_17/0_34_NODE_2237_length_2427_cov_110_241102_g1414_i19361928
MEVTKDDNGTGISLHGSRAAVVEAQDIIQGVLAGEGRQAILPVLPGFLLDLEPTLFQDFQQDICDHVELRYQAEVKFTVAGNRFELLGNFDSPDQLQEPIRALQEILMYYFPENCGLFFVKPIQAMDWICGRDDGQLVRLQGRECVMSADKNLGVIWVCATERQMSHVMSRLGKSLSDWKETNYIIPLENPRIAGWIIGPGGEKLRQLQNETGATISCDGEAPNSIQCATFTNNYQMLSCTLRAVPLRRSKPLDALSKVSLLLGKIAPIMPVAPPGASEVVLAASLSPRSLLADSQLEGIAAGDAEEVEVGDFMSKQSFLSNKRRKINWH